MSRALSPQPITAASATGSPAGWPKVGVGIIEFVAVDAMSGVRESSCERIAAHEIFPHRDRFEMVGADAQMSEAVMVDCEPLRDRADKGFIGEAMSEHALTIQPETTVRVIGVALESALPQPAGISLFDKPPEAGQWINAFVGSAQRCVAPLHAWGERIAMIAPTLVMLTAQLAAMYRSLAFRKATFS